MEDGYGVFYQQILRGLKALNYQTIYAVFSTLSKVLESKKYGFICPNVQQ